MSTIAILVSPRTYVVSLGAMVDLHARLGDVFETNAALGDYAKVHTRLMLAPVLPGPVEEAGGRSLPCDTQFAALDRPRILYLPSFRVSSPDRIGELLTQARPFHAWLATMARAGMPIGACGASAFHLAAAGLLDGRECAVAPRLVDAFRERFPGVRLHDIDPLCVSDRIMTCSRDWHSGALAFRLFAAGFSVENAQSLAQREPPLGDPGFSLHEPDPVVARAKQWIHDRYTEDFRLADLARDLGVTHQGLIRRFRAAGEETPRKYVQHRRVHSACSLLTDTNRSIADIAQLVGYRDLASFRQVFMAFHGMTPDSYRRARRAVRE